MTPPELAELVEWIEDRWGSVPTWANARNLTTDFEALDATNVWAAVHARLTNPDLAKYAPRPADIIAGAHEQARIHADPTRRAALPESTDRGSWAEYSQKTYGEVISIQDAIKRRHADMEGLFVEDTDARLPGETAEIEDGMRPKIQCKAPDCDIHDNRQEAH